LWYSISLQHEEHEAQTM